MRELLERISQMDEGDARVLLRAAEQKDALTLRFHLWGPTWTNEHLDEVWQVTATDVADHRLTLDEVFPRLEAEHPRLRERQAQWVRLMFSAAPTSEEAFLSDLRRIHQAEWGPFGRFGLGRQLSLGYGEFAHGPQELMEVYAPILQSHGMRPSCFWRGLHPEHLRSPPPSLCLCLTGTVWEDDAFILAQSFHAERLT